MDNAQILVVEDEIIVAKSIQKRLENLGYSVPAVVASGEEAVEIAAEAQPDLVLMDIRLKGDMDGIEAAGHIQTSHDIPIVYLTAYADEETLERAKVTDPSGYLLKPFELNELRTTVEMALYKYQMQCRLRDNERWLAATLKSIGDGVITADTSGYVTYMNPMAEALTGWKRQEALGKALVEVFNIIDEDTRRVVQNPVEQALGAGVVASLGNHTLLVARDGTETPIDDSGASIVDDKGNVTGSVLVFHDISQRRQAEEALRQRNRELELLNRASQAFISTLDLDHVLATVLDEVRRVLGVVACSAWLVDSETAELVCRQVTDPQADVVRGWRLAPGQGLAGWAAQRGESLNVSDALTDERHFEGVDIVTGLPLRSILTVPLRVKETVVGVIQVVDTTVSRFDSTDLRLLESLASAAAIAVENARLYEESDRLRAFNQNIVQSIEEGIVLLDEGEQITFVNPRGAELLGHTPEELIGQHWETFAAPGSVADMQQEFAKQRQGAASQYEAALLTGKGQQTPVLISARPLYKNGRFNGVLAAVMDIRERKRAEEERERLIAELQEALAKIKTLRGLIPICASCKNVRDDQGYWQQVEVYIRDHSEAEFSHGLCPDCARELYPEFYEDEGDS
jgi:PAS domain S-box-containing protein